MTNFVVLTNHSIMHTYYGITYLDPPQLQPSAEYGEVGDVRFEEVLESHDVGGADGEEVLHCDRWCRDLVLASGNSAMTNLE